MLACRFLKRDTWQAGTGVILSPGVVIDPFIEHGLVTRTEGRSIERTELTVDVGGTYPSHGEVETFPVERCVYATGILRNIAVADSMYIVGIHLTITCEVNEYAVTRTQCNLLVRHVHTVNFLVALFGFTGNIELKEVVAERLTYRMTGTVHVREFLLHFCHFHHLVACESECRSYRVVHFTYLVGPAQGHFIAMVLDTAKVDGIGLESGNTRDGCFVGNEDVLAVFPEEVDTETQAISKEVYIGTIVLLGGCFPSNIGVTVAGFACTGHEHTVVGTEVTCTVVGPPCTTVVGVELPCTGQIEEAADTLVITYFTDRTAKFKIRNHLADRLPEFFRGDDPAERSRREKTKAFTFGEVL